MSLTVTESAQLIRAFSDHQQFAKESLRIRAKSGAMVPFELQPAQTKLNKAILKQRNAGLPVRICYLKAGQVMVSAGTAAQNFHAVPFMPGRHCLALADSAAHADLVFNYYKGFQDHYVPFTGGVPGAQVTLPELVNDRDETLKWANDSFIQIATGRNVHVGRAHPWQFVQVSEFGFQEGGATLMDGLMQRVPNSPETMVIVESTGFGEGGPFYELCQRAQDPQRAGGWLFVFFGWQEHPEYQMPVPGGDRGAFQRDLDRGELAVMQQYGLSLEQMAWRRWAILNNCEGHVSTFQQEFPSNPRECFQSSNRTYLDLGALERCVRVEEPMRGELDIHQVGPERRVQFLQKDGGTLAIYRIPKKGGRYVIGADSAQGKDPEAKKGGRSDPDYASADVTDADTGEQVAKYNERVTESHFGRIIYALGWYYNWAYVVPETVGAGRAFLQALLALEYPTDRIYRKQRPAGDMRPVTFNELGYDTNTVTRPQLLSALDVALLEGSITIHDAGTAMQCRTLVRDADGHVAAKLGTHDDDVFSKALGVIGLRFIPKDVPMSSQEFQKQWNPQSYKPKTRDDDDD
jgi:hypothetical protein